MSDKDEILNTPSGDSGENPFHTKGKQPAGDKLTAYLDGQLTPEEQYEIEQWMSDEGMESDAIDGLKMLEPNDTKVTVNRLNHNLHKTLHSRKGKRRPAKTDANTIITIVVITLLAVVAFLVIKMVK
ncbi:hypothetical protein CJD36_007155 [Flavipsychrobacter stenotrophus]|uniref:Uncharacterized protein n=1 Tax=Flavipsychrobacter stenotrophus TaxID=2077091 RepID=A0A2S7SY69_9BACT|nr:hypothetical protein [Flavipsychrobacter stenotrophus]PQJ11567.1 hypothetical protein CJD36_007155 [Flavipsychrobacter stenotrophus]